MIQWYASKVEEKYTSAERISQVRDNIARLEAKLLCTGAMLNSSSCKVTKCIKILTCDLPFKVQTCKRVHLWHASTSRCLLLSLTSSVAVFVIMPTPLVI